MEPAAGLEKTLVGTSLSQRLSDRYALKLPADVTAWIDRRLWQGTASSPYGVPYDPEDLLDERNAPVWGGTMPPDALPLLGDGCGDALCLRAAPDGSVAEYVAWDHETGEWISAGRTLADALIYDAISIPVDKDEDPEERFRFAERATQFTPIGEASFRLFAERHGGIGAPLRSALLGLRIAEVPLLHDLSYECVTSGIDRLCRSCEPGKWQYILGDQADALASWPFDRSLVPERAQQRLAGRLRQPREHLFAQDWSAAAEAAGRACRLRPDLPWAHAVLGWEAERRGDRDGAIQHHARGLRTLAQTQSFVANWYPVEESRRRQFAAVRLFALASHLPDPLRGDAYLRAHLEDLGNSRDWVTRISDHWVAAGESAERRGRPGDAYACYYFAGWDYPPGGVRGILERVERAAGAAGSEALRRIAGLHVQCSDTEDGERERAAAVAEAIAGIRPYGQAAFGRICALHLQGKGMREIVRLTGYPEDLVDAVLASVEGI